MSRVMFCWELGDDYGHLGKFHPVVVELSHRGHEVYIVAKDLSKVEYFYWPDSVKIIQAPEWKKRLGKPPATQCFADILLMRGYEFPASLKPVVRAWMHLFDLIRPDVIVLDHSPTALLASRGRKIPRMITSYSFVTPPAGTPPISMRPWEAIDVDRMIKSESMVVTTMNQLAAELNIPSLTYASDIFDVEKVVIYGYKEVDVYRTLRKTEIYNGALIPKNNFSKPVWPYAAATKIFAYLKYGNPQSEIMLSILTALQANVVCFYSGAKPIDYEKYQSPYMHLANTPFDINAMYQQADVVVCHAGGGMVYSALYYGCPMILLPLQLEQYNTSHILDTMKIAILLSKDISSDDALKKVNAFFTDPVYRENAAIFSQRIKSQVSAHSELEICNEIEKLIVGITS